MSMFWSLKGKKNWGYAYWKSRSGSIFLNNIYEDSESFGGFIANLVYTMFHEHLHIFFKFTLGKFQNSCKTIIDPISWQLCDEMANDKEFVSRIVDDFMDLSQFKEKSE